MQNEKKVQTLTPLQIALLLFGLIIIIAGSVWFTYHGHESPSVLKRQQDEGKYGAYLAASEFVTKNFPAVKECPHFDDVKVTELSSNSWAVAMTVKATTGSNAPIQKDLIVDVEWKGNGWQLKNISAKAP